MTFWYLSELYVYVSNGVYKHVHGSTIYNNPKWKL